MLFYHIKEKREVAALAEAMANGYNTVLYEAPHRLEKLLESEILDCWTRAENFF